MGTRPARVLRNSLWSAGVLTVIATLAIGLPALNKALPDGKPIPAGPYVIGAGVTVVPPAGARLDVTRTVPGTTAQFVIGGIRYAVTAVPYPGSLAGATEELRRKIGATRGYQVTGAEVPTATAAGVPGRQGGYASPGRDGRYVAFLHAGTAVEITFAGADPELRNSLDALEASVASVVFQDGA
jgi:hypothetical protein